MQLLRERHRLSREALKDLMVRLSEEHGLGHIIAWDDFAFKGKSKGTTVQGEIFEGELHLEIAGWLEKFAVKKFRTVWKGLVVQGMV